MEGNSSNSDSPAMDESQVDDSDMTQDDDFPSLAESEDALPKEPANIEEEKTNDPQLTDEEIRMSIEEEEPANIEEEKTKDPQLTDEETGKNIEEQEPANIEEEKTTDPPASDEETRLSIADQDLFKRRAFREIKLGVHQSYPIIWIGDLFIANLEVRVAVKFIYGDIDVFRKAVPPCTIAFPGVRMRNKRKLDDLPKEDLKQKMQAKKGSCVLIALPLDFHVEQYFRLQKRIIPYFVRHEILGVSQFPEDGIPEKSDEQPKKVKETSDEQAKKMVKASEKQAKKMVPTSEKQHKKMVPTSEKQAKKMITSDKQSKKRKETIDDQSSRTDTSTSILNDDQSSITETSTRATNDELASKQTKYEMKVFCPSKFVYQNLLPIAPTLAKRLHKDQFPYLMLVISDSIM